MARPGGFDQREWQKFVASGRKLVRSLAESHFGLGDLLLTKVPYAHGRSDGHVNDVIEAYADELGMAASTLMDYRRVAHEWPAEKRVPTESWTVHQIFAPQPNRFWRIKNPPKGFDHWTTNEALRVTARKPDFPVTPSERVAHAHELLKTDEDAAAAVSAILRKPEVAKRVVSDPATRHTLHRAEMSHYEDRRVQERRPVARSGGAKRARSPEARREILQLLGICTAFYTQMQRAVPQLNVMDYNETEKHTVLDSIVRVRAAADWCETVINTGDTSMDEALIRMLEGDA